MMDTVARVQMALLTQLRFEPTASQSRLIAALARFILSDKPNCLLIASGYAGTGKTTLVSALVNTLGGLALKSVLLAPTGRAAKVLAGYSGTRAYTIHKKIYFRRLNPDGSATFALARNLHTNTIFVVDEASMIGNERYSGSSLLEDLVTYVFSGLNCRLLLVGDGAQLPPVGLDESPALNLSYLKSSFHLTAAQSELREVTRQSADSGILQLATLIRAALWQEQLKSHLPFQLPDSKDVKRVGGDELQEYLEAAFARHGQEGTILITRSNKRANLFNQNVRARIHFREELISGGDMVMVVKNNYHWLDDDSHAGFIANGDVAEVLRLGRWESRCGFQFVQATLRLVDYQDEPPIEVWLWLDSLNVESPAMPQEAQSRLYHFTLDCYADLPTKAERIKAVKSDPFYNALQVKFAYAVTCHKAQGGQWPAVFVDQGYLTDEMIDTSYLRWLYTAVSRATKELYLVNFSTFLLQ